MFAESKSTVFTGVLTLIIATPHGQEYGPEQVLECRSGDHRATVSSYSSVDRPGNC